MFCSIFLQNTYNCIKMKKFSGTKKHSILGYRSKEWNDKRFSWKKKRPNRDLTPISKTFQIKKISKIFMECKKKNSLSIHLSIRSIHLLRSTVINTIIIIIITLSFISNIHFTIIIIIIIDNKYLKGRAEEVTKKIILNFKMKFPN